MRAMDGNVESAGAEGAAATPAAAAGCAHCHARGAPPPRTPKRPPPWRRLRGKLPGAPPPATLAIAAACVFMYAVRLVAARAPVRSVLVDGGGGAAALLPDALDFLFAMHGAGLSLGFFWTPLTYVFLHASAAHLLLNLAGVMTFGSALERGFGRRVMLAAFFISGVAGGLGWAALGGLGSTRPCVGASAAALGVAGAFAALRPKAEFGLLIPFFNPWVRAWELAAFLFAADALELFWGRGQTAYSAHLFGIATGVLCGLGARRLRARRLTRRRCRMDPRHPTG